MAYNGWKMMDKVTVAIKTAPDDSYYGRVFNGFVVDASDKKALETAKGWARERKYDNDKQEYTDIYEPETHTFDNGGFSVKILNSAGGSSQGGRLSFLACEIEKEGIKFVIGVNDALLVDLIRNSDIHNGIIDQKVMFVRKGGQPGFIHEGMDAYKEARADTEHKQKMQKAKKTSKWEIGGVYQTITQMDVCIGDVFDKVEEYQEEDRDKSWYRRYDTKYRNRDTPAKVTAWIRLGRADEVPSSLTGILKEKIDSYYVYFETGKPPARAKTAQLTVTDGDMKLIDKMLSMAEYGEYNDKKKGRYVRGLK